MKIIINLIKDRSNLTTYDPLLIRKFIELTISLHPESIIVSDLPLLSFNRNHRVKLKNKNYESVENESSLIRFMQTCDADMILNFGLDNIQKKVGLKTVCIITHLPNSFVHLINNKIKLKNIDYIVVFNEAILKLLVERYRFPTKKIFLFKLGNLNREIEEDETKVSIKEKSVLRSYAISSNFVLINAPESPSDLKKLLIKTKELDSPDTVFLIMSKHFKNGGISKVIEKNSTARQYIKVIYNTLPKHKVVLSELINVSDLNILAKHAEAIALDHTQFESKIIMTFADEHKKHIIDALLINEYTNSKLAKTNLWADEYSKMISLIRRRYYDEKRKSIYLISLNNDIALSQINEIYDYFTNLPGYTLERNIFNIRDLKFWDKFKMFFKFFQKFIFNRLNDEIVFHFLGNNDPLLEKFLIFIKFFTKNKISIIYSIYEFEINFESKNPTLLNWLYDKICIPNNSFKTNISKKGIFPLERMKVFPIMVSGEIFDQREIKSFYNKYNNNNSVLISVGVENDDNVIQSLKLLEEFKLITEEAIHYKLIIYGKPDLLKQQKNYIISKGMDNQVTIMSPNNTHEENLIIKCSDITIDLNSADNIGIQIIKSFLYNSIPVSWQSILTNDLIDNNNTGFIIKERNFNDLRGVMIRLLSNNDLISRLKNNIINLRDTYDKSKILDEYKVLYS